MRVADAIIKTLEINGVKYIFGIPSATFAGILDAMNDSDIEFIITKNEAGASYSASKYANTSKKIAVCALAGGVGVNNAINGIADAQRNNVPMLVISGGVRTSFEGKGALQEFDDTSLLKNMTKYSSKIANKKEVIEKLLKAIKIALTPPCGVVSLSIPFDIQNLPFEGVLPTEQVKINKINYDIEALNLAISEINNSKKGIILVGRGCQDLNEKVKQLSQLLKWPILTTPNAKGVIETDFEYNLGNYGFCSTDGAIEYVENNDLDCVLVLGSSLGQTATRDYNDVLVKNRKLIRIDWNKSSFNKVFQEWISVYYDLNQALDILNVKLDEKHDLFNKPEINKPYIKNHTGLSLRLFMEKMKYILPQNSFFSCDMGDFFNYVYKYLPIRKDMFFQTSINYACMGTGVGGAIGSYLARPDMKHFVIVGDGGFYMNGMEILTAKEYNMPIVYIVVNNSMLGLVNNGLKVFYGRTCKGKVSFKPNNITDMVKGMGIDAIQISTIEEVDKLKDMFANRTSPLVVELVTDGSEVMIDTDRLKKVE